MWLPSTTSLPGLSASRDKQISWHKLTADEMAFHRSCRAQYRSREDPRYAGIRSVAPWNVVASGASAAVATEWRSRVAGGTQRHGVSARGRRRRRESPPPAQFTAVASEHFSADPVPPGRSVCVRTQQRGGGRRVCACPPSIRPGPQRSRQVGNKVCTARHCNPDLECRCVDNSAGSRVPLHPIAWELEGELNDNESGGALVWPSGTVKG